MNPSIEQKIALGFAVAILVLVFSAGAAAWNAKRFEETFRTVEHTHRIIDHLEQTTIGLLSSQTSARGYTLTGNEALLAPYETGRAMIEHSLRQLGDLVRDEPRQRVQFDELHTAATLALAFQDERIAHRRAHGDEAARDPDVFLRGQNLVETARRLAATMQAGEQKQLVARGERTLAAARSIVRTSLIGCGLAVAFLIASGLLAHRDIRRRQRSEAALLKSQRMFQRLFDNAPDAIIQVNRSGHIVRANRQAETLFGWGSGELAGQRIEQLLPPRFHARHGGHLAAYFAAPRTRTMGAGLELFGRRRDHSEFPLDILLSPLETDDGIEALAVIRDITERKNAEEKIRRLNLDLQLQNARLEIANKELESFSYSVSHDLRAPLRHIDGFATLLSKHASQSLDEKSRRFLSVISDSARRMGRLIDDLLTFSRMGRAQMESRDLDLNQLVATVIRESSVDRANQIEWQIHPLPAVHADPAMLRQVWFNLIDNAAKYAAHSQPPRIEIGSLPDSTEHIFYIRDNGVGFDMKYAAKLFGVFQRLHAAAEFEGTGIGLANVRRIVTRHGGRTWAEGRIGAGATFYFSLPKDPAPKSSDRSSTASPFGAA